MVKIKDGFPYDKSGARGFDQRGMEDSFTGKVVHPLTAPDPRSEIKKGYKIKITSPPIGGSKMLNPAPNTRKSSIFTYQLWIEAKKGDEVDVWLKAGDSAKYLSRNSGR